MRLISGLFLFAACFLSGFVLNAQIKTPAPSPGSTVKANVGLGEVTVEYSRPSMKGRIIFGDLVPYGKLWRTGANAATKVTFSEAAMVGSTELAKGTYAIYSIPNPNEWTVIFYKDLTKGGGLTDANVKAEDVAAKIVVQTAMINPSVETFTIDIADVTSKGANIAILWDKTMVKVPFTYKTDEAVMANIKEKMAGPSSNDYYAAAQYYYNENKDLNDALAWVKEANKNNTDKFWMWRQQSLIEAKLGKYPDAIKSAEKSLAIAKEAGSDDYVKINKESIKEWSTKK